MFGSPDFLRRVREIGTLSVASIPPSATCVEPILDLLKDMIRSCQNPFHGRYQPHGQFRNTLNKDFAGTSGVYSSLGLSLGLGGDDEDMYACDEPDCAVAEPLGKRAQLDRTQARAVLVSMLSNFPRARALINIADAFVDAANEVAQEAALAKLAGMSGDSSGYTLKNFGLLLSDFLLLMEPQSAAEAPAPCVRGYLVRGYLVYGYVCCVHGYVAIVFGVA